ncbi:MAG TPA: AlpA family phage regulatory protein [Microvirga sp.]|nr:AlpA family phage regulatory protein [Microvirga sp.]
MSGDLPKTGFVRLNGIIAPHGPIPVGKSTWWAGVKSGRFPTPVKLGPRTTAWRVEDIRTLIREMSREVRELETRLGEHR